MPDLTPSIRAALRSSTLLALVLGFGLSVAPVHEAQAFGAPESFAELAEKISPSVVNITTSAMVAPPTDGMPMVPEGTKSALSLPSSAATRSSRRRTVGSSP